MKIKVNPLDPDSIDEAIAEIEKYEKYVAEKAQELVRLLKDLGLERAKELVPVDTGEAKASIIGYIDEIKELLSSDIWENIFVNLSKTLLNVLLVFSKF